MAELEALQTEADPPALERAACELREHLGSQLASLLQARLDAVASGLDQVWPAGQGERQLTGSDLELACGRRRCHGTAFGC